MFNSIKGQLTHKGSGRACLETGGVEWDLQMADNSISELPDIGTVCKVFVHVYHREDQLRIYGFVSEAERSLFLDLLKVSGIGPAQAKKILSGMSVSTLVESLDCGDVEALRRIPGLGEKTAQKIVLALRGKLTMPETTPGADSFGELIDALVEMGYDRRAVAAAVEDISRDEHIQSMAGEEKEKEIFRRAIVSLS